MSTRKNTSVTIYQYGPCSTCKKALAFLKDNHATIESIDITQMPPSLAMLRRMSEKLGGVRKLFNTSGQVFREMELSKKLPGMSDEEALQLLASHGRLIKRPFLVVDGQPSLVGFKEEPWKEALA